MNPFALVVINDAGKISVINHPTYQPTESSAHMHTNILAAHGLNFLDSEPLEKRRIVRVECRPDANHFEVGHLYTYLNDRDHTPLPPVSEWIIRVDEPISVPLWYGARQRHIEKMIREKCERMLEPYYKLEPIYQPSDELLPIPNYNTTLYNDGEYTMYLTNTVVIGSVFKNKQYLLEEHVLSNGEWAAAYKYNTYTVVTKSKNYAVNSNSPHNIRSYNSCVIINPLEFEHKKINETTIDLRTKKKEVIAPKVDELDSVVTF